MVKNEKQHSEEIRAKQGSPADSPEPYKIGASTPFDFGAKNLTAYGGLLPVATMLEKLGFQKLVEETLTIRRVSARDDDVPIRAGDGAGHLRGFLAAEPSALSGA